jgi:hypothetical protein
MVAPMRRRSTNGPPTTPAPRYVATYAKMGRGTVVLSTRRNSREVQVCPSASRFTV